MTAPAPAPAHAPAPGHAPGPAPAHSPAPAPHAPAPAPVPKIVLEPSTFACQSRTHYFQIPPNPKGTVVFLHGCARTAQGFWTPTHAHPECLGFPEDVSHTKQILAKGYAALIPTPRDLQVLGWSHQAGDEAPLVNIITTFLETHGLTNKPVILGGASAGGGMAQGLVQWIPANHAHVPWTIHGIISEVESHSPAPDAVPHFPPLVYMVMERDEESIVTATQHVSAQTKKGCRAGMVVSPVRKVYDAYFSDRVPGMTIAESKTIVDALNAMKVLDAQGRLLKNVDIKSPEFQNELRKHAPFIKNLTVRTSPIMQALLVAYAQHEHVSDWTSAAIDFIVHGGNFKSLCDTLVVSKPTSFAV